MPSNIQGGRPRGLLSLAVVGLFSLAQGALAHAQPVLTPLPVPEQVPGEPTQGPVPAEPPAPSPFPDAPPASQEAPPEKGAMDLESLLSLFVTSASLQEEPVHETPGPVTVITGEMIQAIGARTLKEILTTYVP